MHNHSRSFISWKRAKAFADDLKKRGAEDVEIWSRKDGFGQTQHTVKWNVW